MNERVRPTPPFLFRAIFVVLVIALYLPLISMIFDSLRDHHAWTTRWYYELWQDSTLWNALLRSFVVGIFASILATVLGLVSAMALNRWQVSQRSPLAGLSWLSLVLPELVLALSLLSWFALLRVPLSLVTVIFAHVTLTMPFAMLMIAARVSQLDRALEEAAYDLGASEWRTFLKVTLPNLYPALMTACVLSFLLSFDDFLMTFFTNGAGGDTLPVLLYSLMKTGLTPKVQALSSIMLVLSTLLVAWVVTRVRTTTED